MIKTLETILLNLQDILSPHNKAPEFSVRITFEQTSISAYCPTTSSYVQPLESIDSWRALSDTLAAKENASARKLCYYMFKEQQLKMDEFKNIPSKSILKYSLTKYIADFFALIRWMDSIKDLQCCNDLCSELITSPSDFPEKWHRQIEAAKTTFRSLVLNKPDDLKFEKDFFNTTSGIISLSAFSRDFDAIHSTHLERHANTKVAYLQQIERNKLSALCFIDTTMQNATNHLKSTL